MAIYRCEPCRADRGCFLSLCLCLCHQAEHSAQMKGALKAPLETLHMGAKDIQRAWKLRGQRGEGARVPVQRGPHVHGPGCRH